ncbi:GDSL esterase/lipase At1g06990-like [Aristolochia californica]|uniref:GDSL esterase/lipase At1g06990-like n=1 Tax=Aristolochia californica TaxID=171875 RepID=UPI0035E29E98
MAKLLFLSLLLQACFSLSLCHDKIPAVLIFGDSTVDTGNNNYIATLLRANHVPYGVNFIGGSATGRFSDGLLVPDLLASALGIKEAVPPFLNPRLSDEDIRTGVCFASAGSGLDDLTTVVSRVIPMSKQTEMLKQYLERLKRIVGEEEASKIASNALILISAGTNDLIFNFYDIPTRRFQYDINGYQDFLLGKLKSLIQEIYSQGGRKFIVSGLAPIGCVPMQRNINFLDRSCSEKENDDAKAYNSKLQKLLTELQDSLPGSRLGYGDIFNPVTDMLNNPSKYGFDETTRGCCGTGYIEMGPSCSALSRSLSCSDPSKFMFWDSVHPSQAVCKVVVKKFLDDVILALYN